MGLTPRWASFVWNACKAFQRLKQLSVPSNLCWIVQACRSHMQPCGNDNNNNTLCERVFFFLTRKALVNRVILFIDFLPHWSPCAECAACAAGYGGCTATSVTWRPHVAHPSYTCKLRRHIQYIHMSLHKIASRIWNVWKYECCMCCIIADIAIPISPMQRPRATPCSAEAAAPVEVSNCLYQSIWHTWKECAPVLPVRRSDYPIL